jgi:hypothetical protein
LKKSDEESINKLSSRIDELSKLKIYDYALEIKLHEARWLCEGSGYINININTNTSIKFYIDKDVVIYDTDDKELLNIFSKIQLDLRLKEVWQLKKQIGSIFNSYY